MRLLAPLRGRNLALLWGGLGLSAIGDQLYAVALTWVAVGVFGAAAGYLTALQAAVVLVTALFAGSHADRWDQRRAMIGADLLRAAVLLLVVTVWSATGAPVAWTLVVAVILLAGGQAIFQPALQAILPTLVLERAHLPAANALLDATSRVARLFGPGLVALLGAALPVMAFFVLDSASFLASALAVASIGAVAGFRAPPRRDGIFAATSRGFATVRRHRVLSFVLVTTGLINGAWYSTFFLGLPLLIERRGITAAGSGLGAYGLVISAYGCTNLLAMLVVGNRPLPPRPGRLIFAGNAVVGSGIILLGLAAATDLPPGALLAALAAAAAFAAIGGPMNDISVAVLRQTELPAPDIAAAMRAFLMMSNAGLLVAMLVAPRAFETLGLPATTILCGAIIVATGAAGLLRVG